MAVSLFMVDPGPLLLCVHAFNSSQNGPVLEEGRRICGENKDPFSPPGRGELSGLAGKTNSWQGGPGLPGLWLRLPDQLSCCYGCWGPLPGLPLFTVAKVGLLVIKSQRWCEALQLARTWWNLSPQLHTRLAWRALTITEAWGPPR